MKVRLAAVALMCSWSLSSANAVERSQTIHHGIGPSDTSLVILEDSVANDSDPNELYSGVYYNSRSRIELQIMRSGRLNSNMVITNNTQNFPVDFPNRLRQTRNGWEAEGKYQVGFLTTVGVLYCSYPVYLTLNFYEEGAVVEGELEYPSYSGISTFGQCVAGPSRVSSFELDRDEEIRN